LLTAIISVNLGIFNLLPIPALDGGRFVFIMLNWFSQLITGKKQISPMIEWYIHVFFFIVLIALSIAVSYNDIIKLL
jgi:regulator of sigma E protease